MASSLRTKSIKLDGRKVGGRCDQDEEEEKRKWEGAAIRRMGDGGSARAQCQLRADKADRGTGAS